MLSPDYKYTRDVGGNSNLSCLIAPAVAAAECGGALSGSERTALNSKPLHLMQSASISYKRQIFQRLLTTKKITSPCSTAV